MFGNQTSQEQIKTGRDNAGGDISNVNSNNTYYTSSPTVTSPIEAWMKQLAEEISTNSQVQDFIDTLQMYHEKYADDGIDGLEAKLIHAGRGNEISQALRKKELFTRLLARYSMFDSAQQIFAYLLSKLEADFRSFILPNLKDVAHADVDKLFALYLINPCSNEIKSGVFCLNAAIASGMIYWLAEQCYIRWHA